MMPILDGWQTLIEVRKFSNVPVVMLTAKSEDYDKLLGFSLGVDIYLTKPISPKIVLANVDAIINRIYHSKNSLVLDVVDGFRIDEKAYSAYLDDEEIILSPKEFELLLYLYKNKGIILTREQILDNVWGIEKEVDFRTVDTHIRRIRDKLKDRAYLISTIRGVGYKFEVKNEKSSIVKKLFIVNFIVFISFIIFSLLIQQIFFEKFYIHKKKKEAEKIITSFAKVYSDTGDLKEAFTKSIEVEEVLGHRFIILDNNGDLKYIINPVNDKFAKGDTIAISDILLKIKTDGLILYLQQDKYLTHVYFNRRFPSNNIVSIYNYKNFEYIVLISSLQPINEASNVIGEFYLYFLLAGVVATIVLSFIYSKTVSKPILEIKEVADRMANLDFSRVIDIKTDDELGMLATAINTMSRNLKNALESLREANKKLEEDIEKEKD